MLNTKTPEQGVNICLQLIEIFAQNIGINFFVTDKEGNRVFSNDQLAKIKCDTVITPKCYAACKQVMLSKKTLFLRKNIKENGFYQLNRHVMIATAMLMVLSVFLLISQKGNLHH